MGSIFAIFRKAGAADISSIVGDAMQELSFWQPDNVKTILSEECGLGCLSLYTTPYAKYQELADQEEVDDLFIVTDSRIDYRIELADQLGIDRKELDILSDSKLILLAYIKWGAQCVNKLYGDFAFVIWDKAKCELFCARDHFGCRPLYYVEQPNYVAIASDIVAFRAIPNFVLQIDERFAVDAICSIYPPKSKSGFIKVAKLEPAHYMSVTTTDPIRVYQYWVLKIKTQYTGLSEDMAISGLRKHFNEALKQRTSIGELVGIELSGGLDSSAILSCLVKEVLPKKDIYTFSHIVGSKEDNTFGVKDETDYINHLHESLDISNGILISGEGVHGGYSAINYALSISNRPLLQLFSAFSDLLLEKGNELGIKVLLSGFGGDEGVTNYGSGVIEEIVKNRKFSLIAELLLEDDKKWKFSFFRLLLKSLILVFTPWMLSFLKRDRRNSLIRQFTLDKRLSKRYQIKRRFKEQVFFPDFPDVRQRQYYRINHSYVLDRLENSYLDAKRLRIEYRYPFLDVKLVEFYYSLRSEYKYKFGMGRYIFRQAMEGIVSDKVRLRQDKSGVTIPNIYSRIIKDKEVFVDLILEGQKYNKFHFVDYEKLIWAINQLGDGTRKGQKFRPRAFLSSISVLILQKWQREGTINIGIKC